MEAFEKITFDEVVKNVPPKPAKDVLELLSCLCRPIQIAARVRRQDVPEQLQSKDNGAGGQPDIRQSDSAAHNDVKKRGAEGTVTY